MEIYEVKILNSDQIRECDLRLASDIEMAQVILKDQEVAPITQ
jgi:hypothetical protein